ncbi:MAG: NAD(P)/FAD-dependent oxidoreductase [Euryarchaeota archaeon]|nr:NAD(P)/FAD-dependent oxidoreductase [Euryarchaeota archaeon]
MDEYDIAVAGGGPVGCFVTEQLASKGRHVAVFEEHRTIGEPVHCAGLVTQRVFDITKCSQIGLVQNKIYGAHIHSPAGATLTIGGETVHGLVINRKRFDETLFQNAHSAGVSLFTGYKVVSAKKQENHITLTIQKDEQTLTVRCNILIGADGPYSSIRKIFGFPHPIEMLQGIGAELSDTALDPRFVHIFVGRIVAPGFFAWIIPTNVHGTTARIGLCIGKQSNHPLQHYFTALLQQPLLQGTNVMKRFGGVIPLGPLKKTVDDHVMLVGDAAAQVKPTSGGGIYPGLFCAAQCAIVAEESLQKQQFDVQFLKHYHRKWTKEIGRELFLGMRFRKMFTSLTDEQLVKYLEKLNNQKTIDVINTHGDIDYPSRLALPLIRTSPSLLSLAPAMLKRTKK